MARYKVELVKEECTACESCVDACPDCFEMGDDDLAHIIGSSDVEGNDVLEADTLGCAQEGADACPVNCIHVYEDGTKIV